MAKDDILRKASQKLGELVSENEAERKKPEQDRRDFISALSREVVKTLSPLIAGLTMQSKADSERITKAIASIQVNVPPIPSPQVKIPEINVPTPKVTVNPPQVKVPQINVPKTEIKMPDIMNVRMTGVDRKQPMPVIMMDTKGKPMPFSMGAGGGGKADFFTIKDIITSSGASIINDAGQLKTDAGTPTLSLDYGSGEIGSVTPRFVMATDAVASVNIVSGSASGTEYNDGDTASTPAGAVAMGDTGEESANVWAVALGSGATGSNSVRVVQATDATSSVNVTGGTLGAVTDITNSVAVFNLDGDGNYRSSFPVDDGGGTLTVDGTLTAVTDITNSVAASIIDSSGVQYSGSNPVPITGTLTGITNSTSVQLINPDGDYAPGGGGSSSTQYTDAEVDATPTGNAIFFLNGVGEVMNVVSSTNALPVSQATALDASIDSITTKPINVRGNLATAYATISTDAETTLLAASAGNYHDLVWVTAANQSDAAVTLDIRMVTGGNTVLSLEVPANATAGISASTPYPQSDSGNNWTVDWADADITGTTVDVSALFNKEAA